MAYLERRKAVSVKATWGRNKQNNASLIIYDIARLQPPLDTFQLRLQKEFSQAAAVCDPQKSAALPFDTFNPISASASVLKGKGEGQLSPH